MPALQFKKATDTEQFFSVYKSCLHHHIDAVFGWDEAFQRDLFATSYEADWLYWIYRDGVRVGMVCFKAVEDAFHVHLLLIFPSFQRQKLGLLSMEKIHKLAREEKRHRVTLSSFRRNQDALTFYQKLGYTIIEEEEHFVSMTCRLNTRIS
ncbi:GNAT family N-acetyltransferase [Veronia pacifica]|uniref:N-acetyltransferase domain-containing protein n=1 Tax=Veronia pacifica TaxID=1080227 RepID=A0A1C3EPS7_9GAMM|nr:GNAT family N-acetyltransferase [Veronia pacifica]ODA35237.1 hypothetical protein A8L45_04815 [Veronia pacifica]